MSMNVGHVYMAIACILILLGTYMGFSGIDPYGDILLVVSIPLIIYGSRKMADEREDGEVANYDVE